MIDYSIKRLIFLKNYTQFTKYPTKIYRKLVIVYF